MSVIKRGNQRYTVSKVKLSQPTYEFQSAEEASDFADYYNQWFENIFGKGATARK